MSTWRYIGGVSTNPGATWRAESGLHWADYDAAGARLACGRDRSTTPTSDELAAWDAAAPAIAARAAGYHVPFDALYLRWGAIPPSGRSRNHATGHPEAGVSVYRAAYDPGMDRFVYNDTALPGAAIVYLAGGAPAYLVTGTEVGVGSDGEPLLREMRILGTLIPDENGFALVSIEREDEQRWHA